MCKVEVTSWVIYGFKIPLITGKLRKGLLVCIQGAWGEIAPLPGRSRETYGQALAQTVSFLSGQTVNELFPSVQFGLESALSFPQPIEAPIYALLSGSPEEILAQGARALEAGHTTVKVKLSHPVSVAQGLLAKLQKQFRLRVDCNSAYSWKEAHALFSPFAPQDFEYIEDPTYERERLQEFPYPLALDETVTQPLESYPNLYGFILKPTVLGGKKGCAPYIDLARRRNLRVVLSSSLESSVGLLQILHLAKHFDLLENSIGLGTHRYLQEELLLAPLDFSGPKIRAVGPPQVNPHRLQEICHGTTSLSHLRTCQE